MPSLANGIDAFLRPSPALAADPLRRMLAAAGDIAYVWDLGDDSLLWIGNSADFARLGGAAAFPDGRALSARLHPDDRRRRETRLRSHRETNRCYDCEYRIVMPDGDSVRVHDRGSVLQGD